jgi:2-phosphosulfolactate phosphatase
MKNSVKSRTRKMDVTIKSLLAGAEKARGTVVLIDVWRAFTTAAYVMNNGAREIIPIGALAEAFELKRKHPGFVLMGEREGLMPEGFDYGNSPFGIKDADFAGRTVVMTTSAGTQGIVKAKKADETLLGSFVCASALAGYIRAARPSVVTLVPLGSRGLEKSVEDESCALYLKSLLAGERPDFDGIRARLWAGKKEYFEQHGPEFSEGDFDCSMDVNRFDFVLKAVLGEYGMSIIKEKTFF